MSLPRATPGPNLAFFSQTYTLQQMVDHIYGRFNALNNTYRPHMFINELHMYIDYWKKKKYEQLDALTEKQQKYLQTFWQNLQEGIGYYKQLLPSLFPNHPERQVHMLDELQADLDGWMSGYNLERTHQGRWCYGKTPMQTFIDTLPIAKEKQVPTESVH